MSFLSGRTSLTTVQTADLADGAVTTAKLPDNAVTLAKMAGGTDGNLIGIDANGDPAYIATGSDGYVLTSGGAGVASAMEAAGGGSRTLIATATASGSATIDFNNKFSSTYTRYEIHIDRVVPATDDQELYCLFKTGTDTLQSSNYNYVITAFFDGASHGGNEASGEAGSYMQCLGRTGTNVGIGNASAEAGGGLTMVIDDPSDTARHTTQRGLGGFEGAGNACAVNIFAGEWATTTAVTGVQYKFASGNIALGEFRLYGVNAS